MSRKQNTISFQEVTVVQVQYNGYG